MKDKFMEGDTVIVEQCKDKNDFYVAKVNGSDFLGQLVNYEKRLKEVMGLFNLDAPLSLPLRLQVVPSPA